MSVERAQRRLAAILAADVVGYSRLMGADEGGTLARLKALRAEVFDPETATHNGRIVKTTGDGVLVEFASAVDAVECDGAVQPEDQRIELRIGINLGDIIVDDDDIYGDGVNIAARMEGLADAGGVRISGTVFDQVRGKLDLAFDDLGTREVKNIAEPVRVYGVALGEGAGATGAAATPAPSNKPSIAVMPFANMSGDVEQEYFADGITEDLITDLSKVSGLFVIARNSSFAYKGQALDLRRVGRELGVRHVLEGSVRKAGGRVRINAQLIDAATGGHLWAERYDGELDDIFTLQDEITEKIVTALEASLTPSEQARAGHRLTNDIEAYDFFLQARRQMSLFTPESMAEAVALCEKAIEIDPGFAAASGFVAFPLQCTATFLWPGHEDALDRGLKFAENAVALDESLGLAHMGLGWTHLFRHDHDDAIESFERATALDPNTAEPYAYYAECLNYAGDPEKGIEFSEKALRFDPTLPPNCAFHLGHSHFLLGNDDDALRFVGSAIDRAPTFPYAHVIMAALHAERNRMEDAAREVATSLELVPGFTVENLVRIYPYRGPDMRERFQAGLLKAGFPEGG